MFIKSSPKSFLFYQHNSYCNHYIFTNLFQSSKLVRKKFTIKFLKINNKNIKTTDLWDICIKNYIYTHCYVLNTQTKKLSSLLAAFSNLTDITTRHVHITNYKMNRKKMVLLPLIVDKFSLG